MSAREPAVAVPGYGDRLLQRLRALKMSQSELAKRARVSRQTLHRAIHRDELTGRVAKKVAAVVGQDLLGPAAAPVTSPRAPGAGPDTPAPAAGGTAAVVREPNALNGIPNEAAQSPPVVVAPAPVLTWFGEVLEALREDADLSQEDAADFAGVSVTTYRRIITGATKPKRAWIERFGAYLDLRNPAGLFAIRGLTHPEDLTYRALGRQLRAWRTTAGMDLVDVADSVGGDAYHIAMYEVGSDDVLTDLDQLAQLYGTTGDVLYRAAVLSLPGAERDEDHAAVARRVLMFESAAREAWSRQRERDSYRRSQGWMREGIEMLSDFRRHAGFTIKEAAKRIGTTEKKISDWEDGVTEPTVREFEMLATLYRTTPWNLRYGGPWERAWGFPNAPEHRSLIFSVAIPPDDRAWLYRYLAELAQFGLGEVELEGVRQTLTSPTTYPELARHVPTERWGQFIRLRMRERAADMWRDIVEPGWRERGEGQEPPLPPALFAAPPAADVADAELLRQVEESQNEWHVEAVGRIFGRGGASGGGPPPPSSAGERDEAS